MTKKVNISTNIEADIQNVSAAVSHRIKDLRRAQNLTLDELSRRSGVSKGMLVEIEKGAANPSIAILCKVAATFGLSLADMVSVAETSAVRLISPEEIPTLWRGDAGGKAELLAGTNGPDMIELWRWSLAPGDAYESQEHPLGTVELFHVEKGVLTLRVNGEDFTIPEGASAIAKTDVPHRYANDGPTELVFSMTVAEMHRARV
ncbi:MAG: XRE family transcriptional regulator [Fimbriimonas sp.]